MKLTIPQHVWEDAVLRWGFEEAERKMRAMLADVVERDADRFARALLFPPTLPTSTPPCGIAFPPSEDSDQ